MPNDSPKKSKLDALRHAEIRVHRRLARSRSFSTLVWILVIGFSLFLLFQTNVPQELDVIR